MKRLLLVGLILVLIVGCGTAKDKNSGDDSTVIGTTTDKKYRCSRIAETGSIFAFEIEYDDQDVIKIYTDITTAEAKEQISVDIWVEMYEEDLQLVKTVKGITTSVTSNPDKREISRIVTIDLAELDYDSLASIEGISWLMGFLDIARKTPASQFRENLGRLEYSCTDN